MIDAERTDLSILILLSYTQPHIYWYTVTFSGDHWKLIWFSMRFSAEPLAYKGISYTKHFALHTHIKRTGELRCSTVFLDASLVCWVHNI